MCGISVVVHFRKRTNCRCSPNVESGEGQRLDLLRNRGPNSYATHLVHFEDVDVQFLASVLHLRGGEMVTQPLVGDGGNVLLWNGEIFNGIPLRDEDNDTTQLLALLDNCKNEREIFEVFGTIQGPWAFIYFFKQKMQLFFGRDIIGRRSLLWKDNQLGDSACREVIIGSVGDASAEWKSVPADGIFCLNLNQEKNNMDFYPWARSISGRAVQNWNLPFFANKSYEIKSAITKPLHECDPENDRQHTDVEKLFKEIPANNYDLLFEKLLEDEFFKKQVESFLDVLGQSVEMRVLSQSLTCANCARLPSCSHRNVAVLFSGGLDCCVLAILVDRFLPPGISVDLINVSFEHSVTVPNQKKRKPQSYRSTFDSPDRLSALKSFEELEILCPEREWNFVEVNVEKTELQLHRTNRVQSLLLPHRTVLDDSIGCALWFAARGRGKLRRRNGEHECYSSSARIVLLGMGADEQLGGYARHRSRFQRDGWPGLHDEVRLEIDRISERNLARDDRIISDSGREPRFPYLDENVVSFLNGLPIWVKTNLKLPRGVGEKLLLRTTAYSLGLRFCAVLPKRAIQFGSRIAHLEMKAEKGSDLCSRLQSVEV